MMNGGPATEAVTAAIHAASENLGEYLILDTPDIDLGRLGETRVGAMVTQIVDPVADYAELMESLFDFNVIRDWLKAGHQLRFDAMHAITGPYATEILERRLGAAPGSVLNATPLPDFGGGHPDPNPVWAESLYRAALAPDGPDFAAASDGDGDRNMILGRGIYVSPSDSLAVLAALLPLCPGYAGGVTGVARSMPTSRAVDRVAAARGLECHATPTGWKFFGTLLDAGRVQLCGEESFGTGSDHVREKDGLWAVLAWLNILAVTGRPVAGIMAEHWAEFGRTWYSRHDYEGLDSPMAEALMADLRAALPGLPGRATAGLTVQTAEDFAYTDPVDGTVATGQGVQIGFEDGARAVLRLSGTGTEGATLRLYLEAYQSDAPARSSGADVQAALAPVAAAVQALTGLAGRTGRTAPDVIT
jgi:phosphoglucomutase